MWHDSILDTIGNTPLVRLNALASDLPCTVLAKVEFFNPGASVKDRIGLAMVDDAERKGLLKPGGTIIEGTSGNTGFGLALVAIARGYSCIFTTTDKQSQAKIDSLRALGAEVIVCPTAVAPEDPRSYYSVAKRLSEEIPNSFYPNQYDHPANAQAHYDSTGPELWEQTEGRITHFIAGAGTGGTISGTTRYLKEQNPAVKSIGVDPYGSVYYKYFHSGGEFDEAEIFPYLTEGVGEDILAGNMNFSLLDDYVRVTDKEAMQMTRRLAKEEGLFVGQSCGMAMAGALDWMRDHAGELTPEDVVVVLLPDNGFRYLAKTFNDDWMRQHGFLDTPRALTAGDVLVSRPGGVFSVSPQASLADAVEVMNEHGISQLPVYDGETLVGSLNERGILARLVADPEARQERVEAVMGEPFPVVEADVSVAGLSAHLENGMGAVLVRATASGEAHILTRSDLIAALAQQTS